MAKSAHNISCDDARCRAKPALSGPDCQDLFHYGLRLVGGDWKGYESAFAGWQSTDKEAVAGLRRLGIKGAAKTKADRKALGFYAIVCACVRAEELGIHPNAGE